MSQRNEAYQWLLGYCAHAQVPPIVLEKLEQVYQQDPQSVFVPCPPPEWLLREILSMSEKTDNKTPQKPETQKAKK